MKYEKPTISAQNGNKGSYAAGCPAIKHSAGCSGCGACASCEISR